MIELEGFSFQVHQNRHHGDLLGSAFGFLVLREGAQAALHLFR
jgi:hypothetical protein